MYNVSKRPLELIKELKSLRGCTLKGVSEPDYYLGGDIIHTKGSVGQRKTKLSAKNALNIFVTKLNKYATPH